MTSQRSMRPPIRAPGPPGDPPGDPFAGARDERGVSLVEVVLAAGLAMVVLSMLVLAVRGPLSAVWSAARADPPDAAMTEVGRALRAAVRSAAALPGEAAILSAGPDHVVLQRRGGVDRDARVWWRLRLEEASARIDSGSGALPAGLSAAATDTDSVATIELPAAARLVLRDRRGVELPVGTGDGAAVRPGTVALIELQVGIDPIRTIRAALRPSR